MSPRQDLFLYNPSPILQLEGSLITDWNAAASDLLGGPLTEPIELSKLIDDQRLPGLRAGGPAQIPGVTLQAPGAQEIVLDIRILPGSPSYLILISPQAGSSDAKSILKILALEGQLSAISHHFVSLATDQIKESIPYGLGILGRAFDCQRVSLFTPKAGEEILEHSFFWCDRSLKPLDLTINPMEYPWLWDRIQDGSVTGINSGDSEGLSRHFVSFMESQGSKEVLIAPLVLSGQILGTILLERNDPQMRLSVTGLTSLERASQIFSNTLYRHLMEEESKETRERFRHMAEAVEEAFFLLDDQSQKILYNNPAFERIFGKLSSDGNIESWLNHVDPEDRRPLIAALQDKNPRYNSLQLEVRTISSSEKSRWIRLRLFSVPQSGSRNLALAGIGEDITQAKESEIKIKEARDRESGIASRIQQQLLLGSEDSISSELEMASLSVPSTGIDGDFMDLLPLPDGSLDLLVGDVLGKGLNAALVGAGAKVQFLRSHLKLSGNSFPTPVEIVAHAAKILTPQLIHLDSFFTAIYLRLIPDFGIARLVDMGHPPLLWYSKSTESLWKIKGPNVPVGFLLEEEYQEILFPLEKGDLLFLYSDGIPEAVSLEGEFYGNQRLEEKILELAPNTEPQELVMHIQQEVLAFSGSGKLVDDMSANAVRIKDVPARGQGTTESFSSDPSEYQRFREWAKSQLENLSNNKTNKEKLLIAGFETFTNIIRHGRPKQGEKIRAGIQMRGNILFFELLYSGRVYEGQWESNPDIRDFPSGGYGEYLISQSTDSRFVAFDNQGQNRVWLAKINP